MKNKNKLLGVVSLVIILFLSSACTSMKYDLTNLTGFKMSDVIDELHKRKIVFHVDYIYADEDQDTIIREKVINDKYYLTVSKGKEKIYVEDISGGDKEDLDVLIGNLLNYYPELDYEIVKVKGDTPGIIKSVKPNGMVNKDTKIVIEITD